MDKSTLENVQNQVYKRRNVIKKEEEENLTGITYIYTQRGNRGTLRLEKVACVCVWGGVLEGVGTVRVNTDAAFVGSLCSLIPLFFHSPIRSLSRRRRLL